MSGTNPFQIENLFTMHHTYIQDIPIVSKTKIMINVRIFSIATLEGNVISPRFNEKGHDINK